MKPIVIKQKYVFGVELCQSVSTFLYMHNVGVFFNPNMQTYIWQGTILALNSSFHIQSSCQLMGYSFPGLFHIAGCFMVSHSLVV